MAANQSAVDVNTITPESIAEAVVQQSAYVYALAKAVDENGKVDLNAVRAKLRAVEADSLGENTAEDVEEDHSSSSTTVNGPQTLQATSLTEAHVRKGSLPNSLRPLKMHKSDKRPVIGAADNVRLEEDNVNTNLDCTGTAPSPLVGFANDSYTADQSPTPRRKSKNFVAKVKVNTNFNSIRNTPSPSVGLADNDDNDYESPSPKPKSKKTAIKGNEKDRGKGKNKRKAKADSDSEEESDPKTQKKGPAPGTIGNQTRAAGRRLHCKQPNCTSKIATKNCMYRHFRKVHKDIMFGDDNEKMNAEWRCAGKCEQLCEVGCGWSVAAIGDVGFVHACGKAGK